MRIPTMAGLLRTFRRIFTPGDNARIIAAAVEELSRILFRTGWIRAIAVPGLRRSGKRLSSMPALQVLLLLSGALDPERRDDLDKAVHDVNARFGTALRVVSIADQGQGDETGSQRPSAV